MASKRLEEVVAWQKSRVLMRRLYEQFAKSRDFGFRDQICRAAVSVMSNVAEGVESGTQKELKRFLFIARGSAGEVRSLIYVAYDLKYISLQTFLELRGQAEEVSRVIAGFLKKL